MFLASIHNITENYYIFVAPQKVNTKMKHHRKQNNLDKNVLNSFF